MVIELAQGRTAGRTRRRTIGLALTGPYLAEALERRCYLSVPAPITFSTTVYPGYRSAAVADFNQDGRDDVIAEYGSASAGTVSVFTGNSQGGLDLTQTINNPHQGFGDSIQVGFQTILTGDFFSAGAGKGVPDAIVINDNDPRVLRLQSNGDGTFNAAYSPPLPTLPIHYFDVASADFIANDGSPDLVVSGEFVGGGFTSAYFLQGDNSANFTVPNVPLDSFVGNKFFGDADYAFGDLNKDGKLDLAALNGNQIDYAMGNGDGTFQWGAHGEGMLHLTLPNSYVGEDLKIADVNGDGNPDLIVGAGASLQTPPADPNGVLIYLGNGDGTFQSPQFYATPTGFSFGLGLADLNGDGIPDLVVGQANLESGPVNNFDIFPGIGGGRFAQTPIQIQSGGDPKIYIGDFNGDGKPDVLALTDNGMVVFSNTTVFPGEVRGRVFNDYNADGVFTPGLEQPLAGRTVYVDLNNNGQLDPGEPTATTDVNGNYQFQLPPGTYHIRQVLSAGWYQTTPQRYLLNPFSGSQVVTIAQQELVTGKDFGETQLGGLSGHVYYDSVGDGIERDSDASEPGVTVYVDLNHSGVFNTGDPSAVSDAKGNWSIPNLFPGKYEVRVVTSATLAVTEPAPPSGSGNGYYYIPVFGGLPGGFTDFGVIVPTFISGVVYKDLNGNGTQDPGEPGLADWTVFLDINGNGSPDIGEPYATTDANGNYTLRTPDAPMSGSYTLKALPFSGYNATAPVGGVYAVSFNLGDTLTGKNFGFVSGALNNAGFKPPLNLPSQDNPYGIVTGDFNKDGHLDFVAVNNSGNLELFEGDGAGHFTSSFIGPTGGAPRAVAAADLNHDGNLDLVTANQDDSSVSVFLGNGNGTFKTAVSYPAATGSYAIAIADFNGDGIPDIAVGGQSDSNISILLGNGDGTFKAAKTFPADFGTVALAAGDFNGDNKIDLATAQSSSGDVAILMNTSSGGNLSFSPPVLLSGAYGIFSPRSIAVADVNGDNHQDLIVTNEFADNVVVLTGNGNGTFNPPGAARTFPTGSNPAQVVVADVNNDGRKDLLVAYRSDGTTDISGGINVLLGHGDGTFDAALTSTAHTSPLAVAVGDFNGDGLPDLVAANLYSDDVSVMLNARGAPGGSIAGTVFVDANGNGARDPGEAGLAGVQVYLDANNNGKLDPGETVVSTDAAGNYLFGNLPPGNYTVREVVPAGYARLAPGNGQFAVTVGPGAASTGDNFADVPVEIAAPVGGPNNLIVRLNTTGEAIEVFQNVPVTGAPSFQVPVALGVPLVLDGGGAGDALTIDFSAGAPLPAGGLTFKSAGGPLGVTLLGPGVLNWGTDLTIQSAVAPAVALSVGDGSVVNLPGSAHFASLALSGSAQVNLAPGSHAVLQLGSLSLAGGAVLDLADNAAILEAPAGAGPATLASILADIGSARNGGTASWLGAGITSSLAAGRSDVGIGALLDSRGQYSAFHGVSVDANSILLAYTYNGDANLDGQVNFSDLLRVARDYGATGATWEQGDFDYDGTVNFNELVILARNYGKSAPTVAGLLAAVRHSTRHAQTRHL